MKTEINIPNETPKELKFPLLAKFKATGIIYCFMEESWAICFNVAYRGGPVKPLTDSRSWEILPPGTTPTLIQE